MKRDDWDLRVSELLWAYWTTCKTLTGHTPFSLVYGHEIVVPMEYIVPSLCTAAVTSLRISGAEVVCMSQLLELEEDRFIVGFLQQVQKAREKAWHDRHIKQNIFQLGDLVLLYDSKFFKDPRKFRMHWLGPFVIKFVTNVGIVQLETLNGEILGGLVNGNRLKLYNDSPLSLPQNG